MLKERVSESLTLSRIKAQTSTLWQFICRIGKLLFFSKHRPRLLGGHRLAVRDVELPRPSPQEIKSLVVR